MPTLRVTIIVDDTAQQDSLTAAHGVAFWIELDEDRILFDTGPGEDPLRHNTEALGIDLSSTQTIVLSHGHNDHTDGLPYVLKVSDKPRVYLHPAVLAPKFHRRSDGSVCDISMPRTTGRLLLKQAGRLIWCEKPRTVAPQCSVTGPVPRVTPFEDEDQEFFRNASCTIRDSLIDDQSVFISSREGLVVLLGCAHAGVINTLRYAQELSGKEGIHAVIGGMHLASSSEERIRLTQQAQQAMGIDLIAPCHCTGEHARQAIQAALGPRYFECGAGSTFTFELAPNEHRQVERVERRIFSHRTHSL